MEEQTWLTTLQHFLRCCCCIFRLAVGVNGKDKYDASGLSSDSRPRSWSRCSLVCLQMYRLRWPGALPRGYLSFFLSQYCLILLTAIFALIWVLFPPFPAARVLSASLANLSFLISYHPPQQKHIFPSEITLLFSRFHGWVREGENRYNI